MEGIAMENPIYVEPDLDFIKAITSKEGNSLKKCYQCATCSVSCSLSHDETPFPRKEMIFASWGLKERLLGNPDIWLCHNCGDCSTSCPRGARPGDVLSAIRRESISHYSKGAWFTRLHNEPGLFPFFFIIPAVVIMLIGFLTGMIDFTPGNGKIVYAKFFTVELIEMIFIPLSIISGLIFLFGLKRFITDMTNDYERRGMIQPGSDPAWVEYIKHAFLHLLPIIKHEKFSDCKNTSGRKISHIMVSFSFVSLAFVAGFFALSLYLINSHAPYPQIHPVKILANFSGLLLIGGSLWLLWDRQKDKKQISSYFDWYLPVLAVLLGGTGMMTQIIRLIDIPAVAYPIYFIHLILAFNLVAFIPYSKLAHAVYRTVAATYDSFIRTNR